MISYPAFDQVHVVSDLHLGGAKGFQVFDLAPAFRRFVDHLTAEPTSTRLALVINGDMVDFLAEKPASYFDPEGAVTKLERIATDPAFAPAFWALRNFVRRPGRRLVVTLGNHDLELALPWVRERFLDILSGGQESGRGRILLSFDGSGFLCGVGDKLVLCVHGNEVDTWNVTDYEALRRIGRDLHQGHRPEPWTPNAGSRLVVDVINEVKARHPFVDLLKPETEAALPTLLAVDPRQAAKILRLLPAVGRRGWAGIRQTTGLLSQESIPEVAPAQDPEAALEALLRNSFRGTVGGAAEQDGQALLDQAEMRLRTDQDPLHLIPRDQQTEYLGYFGAAWKALLDRPREELLLEALEGLEKDRSFELDQVDETFTRLDETIAPRIDYLVVGHTHLERMIPRRVGGGLYFNSGTWIRLIRFSPEALASPEAFREILQVLEHGTLKALDEAGHDGPRIVLRKPAVVSIRNQDGRVDARLRRLAVSPLEDLFSDIEP